MAAAGRYITQADCERRMSARAVLEIFNDDGSGNWSSEDLAALEDHIEDAESEVEQVVTKTYGIGGLDRLRAMGTSCPRSVKRLCLDLFEVRAIKRHPEYIRGDWQGRESRVEADLTALRVRELELEPAADDTRLEPAMNEGGDVASGDPDNPTPKPMAFVNGTGAF